MVFTGNEERAEECAILSAELENRVIRTDVSVSIKDGITTIDVRGLEPPQPLVEIISLVESPDVGDTIVVLHDRDPLLLYPELEERGWDWKRLPSPEGELHLRLTRNKGAETN